MVTEECRTEDYDAHGVLFEIPAKRLQSTCICLFISITIAQ